jgi:N-acetyltransferase
MSNRTLETLGALRGKGVALVPVGAENCDLVARAMFIARAEFRFYALQAAYAMPPATLEEARAAVASGIAQNASGTALFFATHDLKSSEVVGSTAFLHVDLFHKRLEIGATWLLPAFQRSHVNTEAKWLGLRAAFETLGCLRVGFRTDVRNVRSRAAIARLGAREEGVLRSHSSGVDGSRRDTICFSITNLEWPSVDARLRDRIASADP